jgi:hypothetical protein
MGLSWIAPLITLERVLKIANDLSELEQPEPADAQVLRLLVR